jgi:hypothetical protein
VVGDRRVEVAEIDELRPSKWGSKTQRLWWEMGSERGRPRSPGGGARRGTEGRGGG